MNTETASTSEVIKIITNTGWTEVQGCRAGAFVLHPTYSWLSVDDEATVTHEKTGRALFHFFPVKFA